MRVPIAAALAGTSAAISLNNNCPCISGDFDVDFFQLYPENFDFDSIHCKAYFGSNFNATVLRKDLATGDEEVLTFPGISGNSTFHVSGVQFDYRTGAIYFSANNGAAFQSLGLNLTGPNRLIKYDTFTDQVVYVADIDLVVEQIKQITGAQPNGFQDMAEDDSGNAYFIGTYGGAIVKVAPDGTPSIFYYMSPPVIIDTPTTPTTTHGGLQFYWSGISSLGNILILFDNSSGKIFRFNTTVSDPMSMHTSFFPSDVPSDVQLGCDRFYLPPMFEGTVVLCSNDNNGTFVLFSDDQWNSARYLGVAEVPAVTGGITTASAQLSNSLYTNLGFFYDTGVFDQAGGNRSLFPFYDITNQVIELVSQINNVTQDRTEGIWA